ncbi:G-protein alpha subunit-domain-containing protein [Mycena rebaudengoi]|nr:G-protein alpha subunit-domain-containing protein [Mycena rebaudengoi]
MGCVQSSGVDDEAKAPQARWMMAKNEIKMLLLGAGKSGKSTVLKQMKLIHLDGYNNQERDAYKEIIFSNTIQTMPQLDISLAPQNDARRATILAFPGQIEADILPRDVADAVRGLWRDPGVKEADILRSRVKTTGITETTFKVPRPRL